MEDFLFDAQGNRSPSNLKGKAKDNAFKDIRSTLQKEAAAGGRKADPLGSGLGKKRDSPMAGA